MITRDTTKEWKILPNISLKENVYVHGYTSQPSNIQLPIKDNIIWCSGKPYVSETISGGQRWGTIAGYSTITGEFVKEIDVQNLTGYWFDDGVWAIDDNGNLWSGVQSSGTNINTVGSPYYIIINPDTGALVGTIGTSTATASYTTGKIQVDKPNSLVWVQKNNTTLESYDTGALTLVASITLNSSSLHQFVVDEANNELWVYNAGNSTLKRYNSATGALKATVDTLTAGGQYKLQIIPSQNIVVAVGASSKDIQVYSTSTYTKIASATYPSTVTFYGLYYHPTLDVIYGAYLDASVYPHKYYAAFYDRTTLVYLGRIDLVSEGIAINNTGMYYGSAVGSDGGIFFGTIGSDSFPSPTDVLHKVYITGFTPDDGSGTGGDPGSAATSETYYPNSYNMELILDLSLGAFYIYDMEHAGYPRMHDYLYLPGYYYTFDSEPLVDNNGNQVLDGSSNPVITEIKTSHDRTIDIRRENFKFLVSKNSKVTLAEYKDYTFMDWVSSDGIGIDFSSYLLTGYNLSGDMARNKQVIYLQVFCKRTEDSFDSGALLHQSSCMVKSEWDWNTDASQGKWGTSFQAYRLFKPYTTKLLGTFDYGDSVIVTKNKLRGRGHSLSLLFESSAGKDMKLLGWNTLTTINGEP